MTYVKSTGFNYLDVHSSEYDIRITNIENPPPELIEVRDKVPHMDGEYDFSAISGRQHYNNRDITITGFVMINPGTLQFQLKREIINWLVGKGWNKLKLDYEEDFEYTAKCLNVTPEVDIAAGRLNLSIKFEAKPFATNIIDGSEWL